MSLRWPMILVIGLGLSPLVGCAHHRTDLLEAELRTKEDQIYELQAALQRAQGCNLAIQQELTALRQSPACKITPELASQLYTLKGVYLGRLTGGLDEDDCPGDEALQVVLEPHDCDDQTIKAPGSLHVLALQITPEGLKAPLSAWDISPNELRKTWRSSLFGSAYYVVLPWKVWPTSPGLRIVAQFQLADGRVFEADRDVTIHLASGAPYPVIVPSGQTPPPSPVEVIGPDLSQAPASTPNWRVAKEAPALEVLPPRAAP